MLGAGVLLYTSFAVLFSMYTFQRSFICLFVCFLVYPFPLLVFFPRLVVVSGGANNHCVCMRLYAFVCVC